MVIGLHASRMRLLLARPQIEFEISNPEPSHLCCEQQGLLGRSSHLSSGDTASSPRMAGRGPQASSRGTGNQIPALMEEGQMTVPKGGKRLRTSRRSHNVDQGLPAAGEGWIGSDSGNTLGSLQILEIF